MPATQAAVTTYLLGKLGLTDTTQLWDMAGGGKLGAGAQPTDRVIAHLAMTCAMAIEEVENADRQAVAKLARLSELAAAETASYAGGNRGEASWLVQAANQYAQELARQQAGVDKFLQSYRSLAILRGTEPTA